MIITLVSSFFVTWIGLPVIYLLLSKKHRTQKQQKEKPQSVKKQRWVSFFILNPIISFGIMATLIISIILILPQLETGFLPEMDEGSIVLDYKTPPGTSLEETDKILREAEKIIVSVPEVEAYSRRTGTEMGFFITEPNSGDYLIQLKKNRDKTTNDVIEELRQKIESTQPALRVDFGQVIGDMLGDLMASIQPVEIKIFGNDQKKLQELSRQTSEIIAEIPGIADPFDGIVIAGPSISIQPNYAKLAQYGITPADLQYQ